jgi:hypothetical protein
MDLYALPDHYHHNNENLADGQYIDDSSLYVYQNIKAGSFSARDATLNFFYFTPFDWLTTDFPAFLLFVCKRYGFKITGIQTNEYAFRENYETADGSFSEKKEYQGAYKWMLDEKVKGNSSEYIELFERFIANTATANDLERALIYATRFVGNYGDNLIEPRMTRDVFKELLDWTAFFIDMNPEQKQKLDEDIDKYMKAFMQEKLVRNTGTKRLYNSFFYQAKNIFTYKKHATLFRQYLQKMHDDFGTIVRIENNCEKPFPNGDNIETEIVRKRYEERTFLFMHILFAFEKQGLVKILSLGSNWSIREDEDLAYVAKIEILPAFFNEDLAHKLHFDEDKSRFYVQGKEIKLLKFKDEYQTLKVMFEDPEGLNKEWFFSEIAEKIDDGNLDDKKYYNALYQLRIKLDKQGIKDFFITTAQSVKINKKYLS